MGVEWRYARMVVAITLVVVVGMVVTIVRYGRPGTGSARVASTSEPTVSGPAPVPVVPRELLSGDARSFDGGVGDWTASDGDVSAITDPARSGSGSLALRQGGTGGSATRLRAWSPPQKALPGNRYVGSAYVKAVTASRQVRAELRFLDDDGSVIDTETGQLRSDSLSQWQQLYDVAAIAPRGASQVSIGVMFPVVGAGGEHVIDDASLGSTTGAAPNVIGPLRTSGNQIIDGRNRPLILRGVHRFGLEGGTKTPLPTDAEIAQLKGWGANEVRISLGEQKWLSSTCHYQADYPEVVDKAVQSVTSRGMVALLNLHFSVLSRCGKPGLTPMADTPGSLTFWQQVAMRYADNPLVAFDLFNEPNVSSGVWLNGGPYDADGTAGYAAGMQQLYDIVRSAGAQNLVVISGIGLAERPPTGDLVYGANIAYGIHAYTCPNVRPPACKASHPFDASGPMDAWVAFAKTHPVLVTEFGYPNGDDGRYLTSAIDFAEKHGWGWTGFAWDGGTDGKFDLVQNHLASDDKTVEPNSAGMAIVIGLARNISKHAA